MEQEDVMNGTTRARRRVIAAALTGGLGASLMLGVSTSLAGDANGNASTHAGSHDACDAEG